MPASEATHQRAKQSAKGRSNLPTSEAICSGTCIKNRCSNMPTGEARCSNMPTGDTYTMPEYNVSGVPQHHIFTPSHIPLHVSFHTLCMRHSVSYPVSYPFACDVSYPCFIPVSYPFQAATIPQPFHTPNFCIGPYIWLRPKNREPSFRIGRAPPPRHNSPP